MPDCKQLILSSIPDNNTSSHAFFSILLYSSAQIDTEKSYIIINNKQNLLTKAEKILNNFYPGLEINRWEDFLYIHGDIFSILRDCSIDEDLRYNFSIFEDELDRLTLLKTIFLNYGYFYYNTDQTANSKGYNLELVFNDDIVTLASTLLNDFGFKFSSNIRQNNSVLYTKNSNVISDFMVKMGASNIALEIQNTLAIREMRNSANRQNNCFESNLDKTLNASQLQLTAINYIMDNDYFDMLSESLKEIALARIANPDISLNELKIILGDSISRAGIKYRLDRIIKIYNDLKGDN